MASNAIKGLTTSRELMGIALKTIREAEMKDHEFLLGVIRSAIAFVNRSTLPWSSNAEERALTEDLKAAREIIQRDQIEKGCPDCEA